MNISSPAPVQAADGTTTRQRILAVATELFIEQGYDGTSLREIAERLGFTKAALYYHFQSKEDILRALVVPMTELVDEFMARLEKAEGLEGWADTLAWVVTRFWDFIDQFRVMRRNPQVVEELFNELVDHDEHRQAHERLQELVAIKAKDLREQIRMITAVGAVTGFDDWGPDVLEHEDPEIVRDELVAVVRGILELPPRPPAT